MVIILFVAAAFSLVIGNKIEAVAILLVVFINTAISLIQDGKAERAVEELKKNLSPQFRVLRSGRMEVIASRFIVPGDALVFESGDIILTDDNLSTIVKAIKEGRTIYQNLKKLVRYLITNNLGKVAGILLTPLMGYNWPLLPIQLLWSDVVMESFPGVGISTDTVDPRIMGKKPSKITEPLIDIKTRLNMI
jgi:magnesium-transporting ATPase (P-type)